MAWLTNKETGGVFNTDWLDKERQIAENKKEADKLNGKFHKWDDKRARQEYEKYDYDVTSKEWKDKTMYTGGRYYNAIQKALYEDKMRQKTIDGIKDMSPYIKALDESMRPLSDDVELTRSILYTQWGNSVGLDDDTIMEVAEGGKSDYSKLDKAIGKTFQPKGYLSTSYDEEQNASASGAHVILKFRTPAGTPAIVTSNKMESEIILARNTSYTITGYEVRQVAGTRKQIVFYADVVRKGK